METPRKRSLEFNCLKGEKRHAPAALKPRRDCEKGDGGKV